MESKQLPYQLIFVPTMIILLHPDAMEFCLRDLSGRTPWHQDAAVLSSLGQRLTDMVTVWIPFTKTTKKNGCMITVKEINKLGLLNHISGYRGQVEIKDSKLLNNYKPVFLEKLACNY